jgi:hypothetical protein
MSLSPDIIEAMQYYIKNAPYSKRPPIDSPGFQGMIRWWWPLDNNGDLLPTSQVIEKPIIDSIL